MTPDALPLRLTLDGKALVENWRLLARASGRAACGAAVKADGYGLGAVEVVRRLAAAGCRDFFVATWAEAEALGEMPEGTSLSVLHGVREADMATALRLPHRPVLNSVEQVERWKSAGDRPFDLMVDTGMNRLGLSPEEAVSGGYRPENFLTHLACADEPGHPLNERQRRAFAELVPLVPHDRASLCNSAGIFLGESYHFALTRPGLALYGGRPAPGAEGLSQVAHIEAQVLQTRTVETGGTAGYGATWTAERPTRVAILNIGYADGYLRGFSSKGHALAGGIACPVIGRVSMDLLAVAVPDDVGEGDWLEIAYDLPEASRASGLSQYELLTGLGRRYGRRWS